MTTTALICTVHEPAAARCPIGGEFARNEHDAATGTMTAPDHDVPMKLPIAHVPLKEMDSSLLTMTLLMEAERLGIRDDVISAISHAAWFHLGQTRMNRASFPRTPYIEHPLRNTLRLIRWGDRDRSTVLANIFHDVPEDCSEKIVKMLGYTGSDHPTTVALNWLGMTYGSEMSDITSRVTNPELPKNTSTEDKNESYLVHFREEVAPHPKALLVKSVDLTDNAGSLYHHMTPERMPSLMRRVVKYTPVVAESKIALVGHSRAGNIEKSVASSALMALSAAEQTMDIIRRAA